MGIVIRQSIKDSIVNYLGVAIGALSTLFIYPNFLTPTELGLFQFLASMGLLLSPFILLGATNLAVRYFATFKDPDQQHQGFLSLMLIIPLVGTLVVVAVVAVAWPYLHNYLSTKDPLLLDYTHLLLPLSLFMAYGILLSNYTKNFLRIVVPGILENVWVKIGTATIAVLLFYHFLTLDHFMLALVLIYAVVPIGNLIYLWRLGELKLRINWSFLKPELLKEMSVYGFYGIIGSIGSSMITWLDKAMIPLLVDQSGLAALGIYSIVAYMGTAIDIPKRSIEKITAPLVAQAFVANNLAHVHMLYQKTALNQLIAGSLLFCLIWTNLDDLFHIMPNGHIYQQAKLVVLFLGLGVVIDMATGINSQIITYSQYFRFNFYLIFFLAACNFALNYLFIKICALHIEGAALATLTSLTLYNTVKAWYIWRKFSMQPFSSSMLAIVALAVVVALLGQYIPLQLPALINIALRSALIACVFVSSIYYFRVSPDINELINKSIHTLRGKGN